MTFARPLIGLTTSLEPITTGPWSVQAAYLSSTYVEAVSRSGATAVMLPPQRADTVSAQELVSRLDALIVCGGRDIDPGRYHQRPHPRTEAPQPVRDAWEIALVDAAVASDLPVLGICRGAQLLNVACGGTLLQHVPEHVSNDDHAVALGQFSPNNVRVTEGSRLGAILGAELTVQCHHHQAVGLVGSGLQVVARSDDGIIEAIEGGGDTFWLGVQWHPEETSDDLRLFEALVDAARSRAASGQLAR